MKQYLTVVFNLVIVKINIKESYVQMIKKILPLVLEIKVLSCTPCDCYPLIVHDFVHLKSQRSTDVHKQHN